MSVVVRLPEDLYESARQIAALQGRQPSDLLSDAWKLYVDQHREQLASDFEEAGARIRSGDLAGLTELSSRNAPGQAP